MLNWIDIWRRRRRVKPKVTHIFSSKKVAFRTRNCWPNLIKALGHWIILEWHWTISLLPFCKIVCFSEKGEYNVQPLLGSGRLPDTGSRGTQLSWSCLAKLEVNQGHFDHPNFPPSNHHHLSKKWKSRMSVILTTYQLYHPLVTW